MSSAGLISAAFFRHPHLPIPLNISAGIPSLRWHKKKKKEAIPKLPTAVSHSSTESEVAIYGHLLLPCFSESLPFHKLFLAPVPTTLLQAFSISWADAFPRQYLRLLIESCGCLLIKWYFLKCFLAEAHKVVSPFPPPTPALYTSWWRTTYTVYCPFWNRNMISVIFPFSTIWPISWEWLKISPNTLLFSCSLENDAFSLFVSRVLWRWARFKKFNFFKKNLWCSKIAWKISSRDVKLDPI